MWPSVPSLSFAHMCSGFSCIFKQEHCRNTCTIKQTEQIATDDCCSMVAPSHSLFVSLCSYSYITRFSLLEQENRLKKDACNTEEKQKPYDL